MADDDIRRVVPANDPAQVRMEDLREQSRHRVPLGWVASAVSDRCRYGIDGCDDLGCACTCHDQQDRAAVRAAFLRGLTDGR